MSITDLCQFCSGKKVIFVRRHWLARLLSLGLLGKYRQESCRHCQDKVLYAPGGIPEARIIEAVAAPEKPTSLPPVQPKQPESFAPPAKEPESIKLPDIPDLKI